MTENISGGPKVERGSRPGGRIDRKPIEHRGAHSDGVKPAPAQPPPFSESDWLSGFEPLSPVTTNNEISPVIQSGQAPIDDRSKSPQFGKPRKESPKTDAEGFVTYTLQEGALLRIRGPVVPETDSDDPIDVPAPDGLIVRWHSKDKGRIIKGGTPDQDTMWRYVGVIKTPDEKIRGGWRAWRRDEKGQFTIPVMHPDYKNSNPTLNLK